MCAREVKNGWLTPADDAQPSLPRDYRAAFQRLVWAGLQGLLIFLAFQVYKTVRKFGIPDDPAIAFDHARDVIRLEERLGLFFELDWQRWALDRGEGYIRFFNYLYAWYMWWVIGGMVVLAFLAPTRFRFMRRAFFISMVLVTPM